MSEFSEELWLKTQSAAKKAVLAYAQGIFTPDELSQLIVQAWAQIIAQEHPESSSSSTGERGEIVKKEKSTEIDDVEKDGGKKKSSPSTKVLWRIAQRICSRALHDAWCSSNKHMQDQATENLERYLKRILRATGYTETLQAYDDAIKDTIERTFREADKLRTRTQILRDSATFLKWIQVIVKRKAQLVLHECEREKHLSLEQEIEHSPEKFVDSNNPDPIEQVVDKEQREALLRLLADMPNKKHRQVLLYQYLEELNDTEIAQRMGVDNKTVQQWRYRALQWLRKHLQAH